MISMLNQMLNRIGLSLSERFSSEKAPGSPATEGRVTLRLWEGEEVLLGTVCVEWNLTGGFYRAKIGASDEGDLELSIGLGPTVWVTLEERGLGRLLERAGLRAKEISVAAHDGIVWWKVLADPHSWNSETPRWRDGNWHVLDALLGKQTSTVLVETRADVAIPMPEGSYPATVVLQTLRLSRPRWIGETIRVADVEIHDGIPFSGKGENAWDQDEDGLFSMSTRARSIGDAIGQAVARVYEYRARRGDAWAYERGER